MKIIYICVFLLLLLECNYLKAQDSVYCEENLIKRNFVSLKQPTDSLIYREFINIHGKDTLVFKVDISKGSKYFIECIDYYGGGRIERELVLPHNTIKAGQSYKMKNTNVMINSPIKEGIHTFIVYLLDNHKYCIEFTVSIVKKE
ncbi:hypothetical protein Fleli_0146 [Bernardetia litoralis DSM 6794]|uniref:Uncharacterized protein n=1 Tax=Bernardetia litoralis (strain ATCC 23117 / DSM 6794 / NBRC 15988 / NCIMB 1366 / Fx l1 / Sio-4) TaxID=880071 RepID=I4AFB1_BERLS|nr:hypothetical protein Fleli_0146 [Bernardetia litoralis DSM 6794]